MGLIETLFSTVSSWFGFVGACVVGPTATCIPLVAFVALVAASGAALVLVTRAYRALQGEQDGDVEERRARVRQLQLQQQVRRAVAARVAPRHVAHRGWRLPA